MRKRSRGRKARSCGKPSVSGCCGGGEAPSGSSSGSELRSSSEAYWDCGSRSSGGGSAGRYEGGRGAEVTVRRTCKRHNWEKDSRSGCARGLGKERGGPGTGARRPASRGSTTLGRWGLQRVERGGQSLLQDGVERERATICRPKRCKKRSHRRSGRPGRETRHGSGRRGSPANSAGGDARLSALALLCRRGVAKRSCVGANGKRSERAPGRSESGSTSNRIFRWHVTSAKTSGRSASVPTSSISSEHEYSHRHEPEADGRTCVRESKRRRNPFSGKTMMMSRSARCGGRGTK